LKYQKFISSGCRLEQEIWVCVKNSIPLKSFLESFYNPIQNFINSLFYYILVTSIVLIQTLQIHYSTIFWLHQLCLYKLYTFIIPLFSGYINCAYTNFTNSLFYYILVISIVFIQTLQIHHSTIFLYHQLCLYKLYKFIIPLFSGYINCAYTNFTNSLFNYILVTSIVLIQILYKFIIPLFSGYINCAYINFTHS